MNTRQQDKISQEYDAEVAWENTIKAQPKDVQDKIQANRKIAEENRRK